MIRAAEKKKRTPATTAGVIARRLESVRFRSDLCRLVIRIALIVLVAWLLLSKVFLFTQAHGQNMFPAVKDGDLMIAFRLQREYVKGDVVICSVNGKPYVGRIAARENDVVGLDDTGRLIVNGTIQGGEIIYPTYAREPLEYPYRVPEGNVFLLGDYRIESEDSRDFGPVPMNQVEGKVITILRRREL